MLKSVWKYPQGPLKNVSIRSKFYINQIDGIKEQIRRGKELEDLPAPKLWLNPEVKDFYDFDNSSELKDIKVVDYEHHGKIKFDIAQ